MPRQPACTGQTDVLGTQYLKHACAGVAGNNRHRSKTVRDHRHDQLLGFAPSPGGKPPEFHTQEVDKEKPDDETRKGQSQRSNKRDHPVYPRVLPHGGGDPEKYPQGVGDGDGDHANNDRDWPRTLYQRDYGL